MATMLISGGTVISAVGRREADVLVDGEVIADTTTRKGKRELRQHLFLTSLRTAPEALLRLTESYLAMGVPEEAQKAAAVLGRNYPNSDWYKRAFDLMQKHAPKA